MEVLCYEDSWDDILKFDFKFHEALIAATGSTRLQKFYRSISAEQRLALTYFRSRQSPSHIAREHREILNAIRSGAPDAAVDAFRIHLDERTEKRRGGKEGGNTSRFRVTPQHKKQKKNTNKRL